MTLRATIKRTRYIVHVDIYEMYGVEKTQNLENFSVCRCKFTFIKSALDGYIYVSVGLFVSASFNLALAEIVLMKFVRRNLQ